MSTEIKRVDTKIEFEAWPKIPRDILGYVIITEKMDGTNACVVIEDGVIVGIQSRKRMLNVDKTEDNYGFAGYVMQNEEKFLALGEGKHYGEWAGVGIQKNPHELDAKYFYLFDVRRWGDHHVPPEGIRVVKILHQGEYSGAIVDNVMNELKDTSVSEGYKPEGIIVYFPTLNKREKYTFEYSKGKWMGH